MTISAPNRRNLAGLLAIAICSVLLLCLPSYQYLKSQTALREKAKVLSVDNSLLTTLGLVKFGSQQLEVRMLGGPFKGQVFRAVNELRGQLELDKTFRPGDVIVAVRQEADTPDNAVIVAQDYWRIGWTMLLFGIFCVLLCLFGGWIGAKALFSFVFSCLVIWKLVMPLTLAGWPPVLVIFVSVVIVTAVIMFLVAGWSRCGLTAFAGATAGILAGLLTSEFFTWMMDINGATMPYAQALLYAVKVPLRLEKIFAGAVILASSGAVMDLAMDISSGIREVALHNPQLTAEQLVRSGLRMGRNVVGTMTTTLLLAYAGGYLTLLMMFMLEGLNPWYLLNNPLVAAEAVKTLVGSFTLVLVAPLTALIGGHVFAKKLDISPQKSPNI